jgi:molecular chaperone GrpE
MNQEPRTENKKTKKLKNEKTRETVIATPDSIRGKQALSNNDEQLDEKQIEIDNLKNQLVRALADYQNQNKRFQEERAQIFVYASQSVLENLIPVLDILEKAQEHLQDQGLGMAISEFKRVLKDEGLEEIKPEVHNPFDHELMEVVESVSGDGEKGAVAETVLPGWKFKDGKDLPAGRQVVRFAKVKVFGGE